MGKVSIDIDAMESLIGLLSLASENAQNSAGRLYKNLDDIRLSVSSLSRWRWHGLSVERLDAVRGTCQGYLDKAKALNNYGAGITSVTVGPYGSLPSNNIIIFDDGPVSLEDADRAADLINQFVDVDLYLDGSIPQELLDLLEAGSTDSLFALRLSELVPPDRLAAFLDLLDKEMSNLSLPGADPAAYDAFRAQYTELLGFLGTAYSLAINSLPEGSPRRTELIAAWVAVFINAGPHNADPVLLSLVIARGQWPDDFLTAIAKAVNEAEGTTGAPYWQPWWGPDGPERVVIDPGLQLPDGSDAEIGDPMYGVWLAAAINNPQWFINMYHGGDQTTIDWDSGGIAGDGSGSTDEVTAGVDTDLYNLLASRGMDAASFLAFQMAASIADFTAAGDSIPDDWQPPITTDILRILGSLERDQRLYDLLPFWDKYGHYILGGISLVLLLAAPFCPAGWAGLLMTASGAVGVADGIWYIREGKIVDGVLTIVLSVPFMIGGAIQFIRFTQAEWEAFKAGQVFEAFGRRFVFVGGKPTMLTAEEWEALSSGRTTVIGGQRFALAGSKIIPISTAEWATLKTGKIIDIGGMKFKLIDGKLWWLNDPNAKPVHPFSPDLPAHVTTCKQINAKGITGAHTMSSFEQAFRSIGLNNPADAIISKTELCPGVYRIKYRIPLQAKGKITDPIQWKESEDFIKTVYDQAVVSDAQYMTWCREAMANAKPVAPGSSLYEGIASNGLVFQGRFVNGVFTTVYPV